MRLLPLLLLPLTLTGLTALAQSLTIQGQQIAVTGEMGEQKLLVNNQPLHENALISITEITRIGGVDVVIGDSGSGGNACEGSPFLLALPAGLSPRLDGPIDSCTSLGMKNTGSSLVFEAPATPAAPGSRWIWTPKGGLTAGEPVEYQMDETADWTRITPETVAHPSDLYRIPPVAAVLDRLAGAEKQRLRELLSGVGSTEAQDEWLIGRSCEPHNCGVAEGFVAVNAGQETLYTAWKDAGARITFRPVLTTWPAPAQAAAKDWTKGLQP